jgi:hypothetical protein
MVVQSAMLLKNEGCTDRFLKAKRSASKTAESVKEYVGLVTDLDTTTEIQSQISELEALISLL